MTRIAVPFAYWVAAAGGADGRGAAVSGSPGRLAPLRADFKVYGAGHPMIGTVLMLFCGLPAITRSL